MKKCEMDLSHNSSLHGGRYAFSRTISDILCTFKRFHNFIFSSECEMGISRTWCQSGEFVLECEKVRSMRETTEYYDRLSTITLPVNLGMFLY